MDFEKMKSEINYHSLSEIICGACGYTEIKTVVVYDTAGHIICNLLPNPILENSYASKSDKEMLESNLPFTKEMLDTQGELIWSKDSPDYLGVKLQDFLLLEPLYENNKIFGDPKEKLIILKGNLVNCLNEIEIEKKGTLAFWIRRANGKIESRLYHPFTNETSGIYMSTPSVFLTNNGNTEIVQMGGIEKP